MQWSIGRKLMLLSGVSMIGLLILTLVAVAGQRSFSTSVSTVATTGVALRNHMECDMMHDAIRGDVLRIAYAETDAEALEAVGELREHSDNFRDRLEMNEQLPLGPDETRVLASVESEVDDYLQKAKELGALAGSDRRRVRTLLPGFQASFEELEGGMSNASELLERSATQAEAQAQVTGERSLLAILAIACLACIAAVATWRLITTGITTTLDDAVEQLRRVAQCDLTGEMSIRSTDEVASMARSLNAATSKMGTVISSVAFKADSLAASSEQLDGVSRSMREIAGDTASQATEVSAAAGEASENMQSAAKGVDMMSHSIGTIAQSVTRAVSVVKRAVSITTRSARTIGELDQRSVEIEGVLRLITSIADQTNLLALNAAIEAARAGDAGKGFVVVANEVKELARETSKATEDIGKRIGTIRSGTASAVAAVDEIQEIITEISQLQNSIQEVVDTQGAAVHEVRGSVEFAAQASANIRDSIALVAQVAERSMAGANETQQAASELAGIAGEVRRLAAVFRHKASSTSKVLPGTAPVPVA